MAAGARSAVRVEEILAGAGVVALGLVAVWATLGIPTGAIYARVGPTVFPWAITIGLLLLGTALIVVAVTAGWNREIDETPVNPVSLGTLIAGLLLNVATIDFAGFIPASMILFAMTARAFGSRRSLRDVVYGLILALVAYIGFDRVLGYQIGTGPLETFLSTII